MELTWGKPRDIVWFLKKVTELFADQRTLSKNQINAAVRVYAIDSWNEMKSGLSTYMDEQALIEMDDFLKVYASESLERGHICTYEKFIENINSHFLRFLTSKSNGSDKIRSMAVTMFDLLYQMGIFYTVRIDDKGNKIYDRFHRGQSHPNRLGFVVMHRLVAKSFS